MDRAKRLPTVNHSYTICSTDETQRLSQKQALESMNLNLLQRNMRPDQISIRIDPLDVSSFSLRGQKDDLVAKFNRQRVQQAEIFNASVAASALKSAAPASASNDASKALSAPGSPTSLGSPTHTKSPHSSKESAGGPDQQLSPSSAEAANDEANDT